MILLTACKTVGCSSFHGIRELTEEQEQSLNQSKVPTEWIRDVKDFKDIYKELCE